MPAFPCQDINLFYMTIYGGYGFDGCGGWGYGGQWGCQCAAYLGVASGLPQTGNPPYTVNDFLAIYPKFLGPATQVPATLTANSQTITLDSSATGLLPGQLVAGSGIPAGAVLTTVTLPTATISSAATSSGAITLSVYESPLVPLTVIQIYLNIAFVSLMQSRWREQWQLGMALYIAHYLTLWLETEGNTQTTATQIVANSLQAGITISQGADGVNQGLKVLESLDNWAAWTLTQYGVQLATIARVVGSGPVYWRR